MDPTVRVNPGHNRFQVMPERETIQRARRDAREGKAPSTQAGEFIREEFHNIREGKHGARSPQQAIAIGLSKARRSGVNLPPPARGRFSSNVRRQAARDYEKGRHGDTGVSPRRSRITTMTLKHESRAAASTAAISRQTRLAASRRSPSDRSASARKAAQTRSRRR